ncbi:hypothetical protein ACFL42_04870, partial [Candidatus Omnitrophota bacterium]
MERKTLGPPTPDIIKPSKTATRLLFRPRPGEDRSEPSTEQLIGRMALTEVADIKAFFQAVAMDDPRADKWLDVIVGKFADPDKRAEAGMALGMAFALSAETGNLLIAEGAKKAIERGLTSENADIVRGTALVMLLEMTPGAVDTLKNALKDEAVSQKHSIELAASIEFKSNNADSMIVGADILASVGSPEAVEALTKALDSDDPTRKKIAALTLLANTDLIKAGDVDTLSKCAGIALADRTLASLKAFDKALDSFTKKPDRVKERNALALAFLKSPTAIASKDDALRDVARGILTNALITPLATELDLAQAVSDKKGFIMLHASDIVMDIIKDKRASSAQKLEILNAIIKPLIAEGGSKEKVKAFSALIDCLSLPDVANNKDTIQESYTFLLSAINNNDGHAIESFLANDSAVSSLSITQ